MKAHCYVKVTDIVFDLEFQRLMSGKSAIVSPNFRSRLIDRFILFMSGNSKISLTS